MIVFKKVADIRTYLSTKTAAGAVIGFVPTMGALHPGHISLISHSKHHHDLVVSSIFVNPAQFNDPKDFEKYPSTIEADIDMLEKAGCTIDDVDLVVPHQANQRITDAVASKLGVAEEKVYSNIAEHGNTSSASIPIALDECIEAGKIKEGDLVLDPFCGSGTTCLAAKNLNRKYLGIEINEDYVQLSKERLTQSTYQFEIFL